MSDQFEMSFSEPDMKKELKPESEKEVKIDSEDESVGKEGSDLFDNIPVKEDGYFLMKTGSEAIFTRAKDEEDFARKMKIMGKTGDIVVLDSILYDRMQRNIQNANERAHR